MSSTPSAQNQTSNLVEYHYHSDTDIHEYIYREGTREAVDEWMQLIDNLYADAVDSDKTMVRVLVDISDVGQPPLAHAYRQAKGLGQKYPDLPPRRFCFLAESSVLGFMIKSFISLLRRDVEYNFVSEESREEAIEWLLAKK